MHHDTQRILPKGRQSENSSETQGIEVQYREGKSSLTEKEKSRFWSKVNIGTEKECWNWIALSRFRDGYGAIKIGRKQMRSNRISFLIHYGTIEDGMNVLHSCDNPRCCNPAHLFLGTHTDNHMDMCRKGRIARGEKSGARLHPETRPRGDTHWFTKLKSDQVLQIKRRLANGANSAELAKQYGASYRTIRHIATGKTWGHIDLRTGQIPAIDKQPALAPSST